MHHGYSPKEQTALQKQKGVMPSVEQDTQVPRSRPLQRSSPGNIKRPVSTSPPHTRPPSLENRSSPAGRDVSGHMQRGGRATTRASGSVSSSRRSTKSPSPAAPRSSSSAGSARTPQGTPDPHDTRLRRASTPPFDETHMFDRTHNPIESRVSAHTARRLSKERTQIVPQLKRKRRDSPQK